MHSYLLHQLLSESSLKWPDNIAVIFNNQSMTYSELEGASNQLARLLDRHGVKSGDRVGLMMGKSIESIVSLFGVLKAGAVYVPIDPAAPVGRMQHILRNCGIEFLIASSKAAERLFLEAGIQSSYSGTVMFVDKVTGDEDNKRINPPMLSWDALGGEENLPLPLQPATDVCPAYILHTSGSTGIPKGVVISHLNALTFVEMASDFFGIRPKDRLCNHAPLNFDLSVFDIYVAIKSGAAVVLIPENLSVFPIKLAEYITKNSITIWNSVSSVLVLLAVRGCLEKFEFPALRTVIFSGEILPVKYLRTLKTSLKNSVFYNIYGQTEANSSTYYRVDEIPDYDAWKIPIGKPFPNFEVFLLDEAGRVVETPGGEGELYVKASTVALGYWRDQERTLEKFIPDPRSPGSIVRVYRTGDLVRISDGGNLLFGGRKDHMFKSRGYRIELDEIEIVLNSHPSIREAVVIPVPEDLIGNRIIACVIQAEGADANGQSIRRHCSDHLSHYMVPEEIFFFPELPKNANGKVDRKALMREIVASTPSLMQGFSGKDRRDRIKETES